MKTSTVPRRVPLRVRSNPQEIVGRITVKVPDGPRGTEPDVASLTLGDVRFDRALGRQGARLQPRLKGEDGKQRYAIVCLVTDMPLIERELTAREVERWLIDAERRRPNKQHS